MAPRNALPDKKVIAYFTRVMGDKRASAYRRDQAAKALLRLCQGEARRLKATAAKAMSAPAPNPKSGVKAQRQEAAQRAHEGTGWDELLG